MLSAWMAERAHLRGDGGGEPWTVEPAVIADLDLPPNLQHNRDHPFAPELERLRAEAQAAATEGSPFG